MREYSEEEKKILAQYCTNLDKPIYGLINLPEVVAGALFSRYSRSSKSAREVLLEEFIQNIDMEFSKIAASIDSNKQIVATQKAEEFYNRVLVGYGDDSVAELGGAHMAIEEISNIATKFIEDSRIGLSPLEKSTRYVYFDQKDNDGNYRYYKGKEILNTKVGQEYIKTSNYLFEVYSKLLKEVYQKLLEKYPQGQDISKRAYENTIKAKTCDLLRGLLPASTLTNMGIFANGRAYEYLLTKMYASNLPEINFIAEEMYQELMKIIPSFVKRVKSPHGLESIEYIKNTKQGIREYMEKNFTGNEDLQKEEVELVYYDKEAEDKIIWAILFENGFSYKDAQKKAIELSEEKKIQILKEYVGKRKNRRHKPYRAFELPYYTFSICANFGQYRDIQRHRILTQVRQLLDCKKGYDIPKEIVEFGFKKEFEDALSVAKECHQKMEEELNKELAQYIVPMAYRLNWYINLNLREAFHLIELRSSIQGHADYRRLVIKMFEKIKQVHPRLAEGMIFVNEKEVELERLEAEKKVDKKLKSFMH
ncbi:MAG: FAD-dependent thymidylate synthase [Candidatus Anstonellaceae archaeon]